MNNGNMPTGNCEYGERLVEYLYGEMPREASGPVRRHIAECGPCAADAEAFAALRVSIGDWKAEFDRIPTPPIPIPAAAPGEDRSVRGVSIIESIRALFAGIPSFATAGGAFAVLIIAAVFAFVAFNRQGGDEIAGLNVNNATPSPTNAQAVVLPTPPVAVPAQSDTVQPAPADKAPIVRQPAAVRTDARRNQSRPVTGNQRRPARNAPVLAEDADDEDDGIRLADLFDEIGTED